MSGGPDDRPRTRTNGMWAPSSRRRLWVGLLIAILGPLLITPFARLDPVATFPGVPYVLVVVVATVYGRLLAAGVATLLSVVLLDRYFVAPIGAFHVSGGEDLLAFALFILVALVVAEILVRLDRAAGAEELERDRLAFLARAGDALSGPLDVDASLAHLGDVIVPTLADWFAVDVLENGRIRNTIVVHPDPTKVEFARELQRRFPSDPDAPTGPPNVIRTGAPELTETITNEMLDALIEDPELRATIGGLGLRCAMVLPLRARNRTFGALTLIGAESHERYGPDDLRLAEEIADRAALAIDTARLFSAQIEANDAAMEEARRNAVLTNVTAAFGSATTVKDVMQAMLERGIRLAGAAAGTVGLLADGDRVELVGISGYETDDHPYWHAFSLNDRLPMSDAISQGRPVVVSTTQDRDARFPSLKGRGDQRDHVLVCLPLLLGETPIGGFSASYPPDVEFGEDDLTFLSAIGEQCAQAIDRARSIAGEQETRARFDALARASRGLARTLDYEATAMTVVRLAVEHLGERATLYAREGDAFSVLAEADSAGRAAVAPDVDASETAAEVVHALAEAIERRRPQPVLADEVGASPAGLILPLGIADSTFGALAVSEARRDFRREDEVEFAREMARRMARAMENARLYRERDYVARTLQRSLLPPTLPEVPGLDVEALFLPALIGYEVGGDFYDLFERSDGTWVAVIGDVCGKGVEAAALTGLTRHTLRAIAEAEGPSRALSALNQTLLREHLDGRFCTVVLVVIEPDPDAGPRLTLACAGHPLPHHVAADGSVRPAGRPGTLLGVVAEPRLEDVPIRLGPGEALVLFTDGILRKTEAIGDESEGLAHALQGLGATSANDLRRCVEDYVNTIVADGQEDDIAVLILRAR